MHTKRLTTSLVITGFAAIAAYIGWLRPRHLRWGATADETNQPLLGDEFITSPRYITNRAVTINRPASEIWPWIVQIGQGRGGFYSYDWLENLMGLEIHSTDRILPEYQNLQLGDILPNGPTTPDEGVVVAALDPGRAFVLRGTLIPDVPMKDYPIEIPSGTPIWADWTWTFALLPVDNETTRFFTRLRCDYVGPPMAAIRFLLMEPGQWVMERKMLLGVKARAEA